MGLKEVKTRVNLATKAALEYPGHIDDINDPTRSDAQNATDVLAKALSLAEARCWTEGGISRDIMMKHGPQLEVELRRVISQYRQRVIAANGEFTFQGNTWKIEFN